MQLRESSQRSLAGPRSSFIQSPPVPELPTAQGWDQQKEGLASGRGSKSCSEALRTSEVGVRAYDGSLPPKAHIFSSFLVGLRSESFGAEQLHFKKEHMVLTSMGAVLPPGCSYRSGLLQHKSMYVRVPASDRKEK